MSDPSPTSDSIVNSTNLKRGPNHASADIYADTPTVKIGPRKLDAAPQATFHYGDGKWLMVFKYTKNDKATGKGGKQQGQGVSTDSQNKTEEESSEEKQ
jgi:hypothetical protein